MEYTTKEAIYNLLFSIIVPIYNCEKFLPRCIDSILNQIYTDFELILVNDGSADKSEEICRSYELKDRRIQVISQKNSGVSAARNAGIKKAKGEYVIFIDADDYVESTMLSCVKAEVMHSKFDICFWGYNIVFSAREDEIRPSKFKGIKTPQLLMSLIKKNLFGVMGNKAIRQELLHNDEIYFDTQCSIFEDQQFMMKVWQSAQSVSCMDKSFYYYVQNPSSAMMSILRRGLKNYVEINDTNIEALCSFMCLCGINKADCEAFAYKYVMAAAGNIFRLLCQKGNHEIKSAVYFTNHSYMLSIFRELYPRRSKHNLKEILLYSIMKYSWIWHVPLFRTMIRLHLR